MALRGDPDRRTVALGLSASVAAVALTRPAFAQIAGVEIVAAGAPGDGQDQLARAIAEGLATTKLTPRAMAINVPRDVDAISDFVSGKRSRAALMVVSLSTLGTLQAAGATARLDDCRPLARMLGEHLPIVTAAKAPIQSLPALLDAIRKDTGAVTWAGRAKGSADHILCLRLTKAAGGDPSRLAYTPFPTAAEASNQVLMGRVTVATGSLLEFIQQIRGGTLTPLALGSAERARDVDIPTLREQQIDVAEMNWRGVVTRDAVGNSMIDRYGEALRRLVLEPGWRQMLQQRFWPDLYQPAADFARFLAAERARVAAISTEFGAF